MFVEIKTTPLGWFLRIFPVFFGQTGRKGEGNGMENVWWGFFFLGMTGLLFYPWQLSILVKVEWKPGKFTHQVKAFGRIRYLWLRRERLFQQQLTDEQVLQSLGAFPERWGKQRIFSQSFLWILKTCLQNHPRTFRIRRFSWQTTVGMGTAAHTAVGCGILWGIKGMFCGRLGSYLRMEQVRVQVFPDYQMPGFEMELLCIIPLSLVQIIHIAFLMFLQRRKIRSRNR